MKLLFDFFPVVLFFIVYKMHDDPHQGFIVATAAIIAATVVQVLVLWLRERRVEKMHLVVLALVMIFGGITLIFDDEIYLKWKAHRRQLALRAGLPRSEFIGGKSVVRRLMESKVKLPGPVWTRLNASWVIFFAVCGALEPLRRLQLRHRHLGGLQAVRLKGLTLVFVLGQGVYMARHMPKEEGAGGADDGGASPLAPPAHRATGARRRGDLRTPRAPPLVPPAHDATGVRRRFAPCPLHRPPLRLAAQ